MPMKTPRSPIKRSQAQPRSRLDGDAGSGAEDRAPVILRLPLEQIQARHRHDRRVLADRAQGGGGLDRAMTFIFQGPLFVCSGANGAATAFDQL